MDVEILPFLDQVWKLIHNNNGIFANLNEVWKGDLKTFTQVNSAIMLAKTLQITEINCFFLFDESLSRVSDENSTYYLMEFVVNFKR